MFIPRKITEEEAFYYHRHIRVRNVVSIKAFFKGNIRSWSIARTLKNHPGIPVFYETLKSIRRRADVEDVWIEIADIEIFEDDDHQYLFPFSERVYIITSATKTEVSQWVEPLRISGIEEGWRFGEPPDPPAIPKYYTVYGIYWQWELADQYTRLCRPELKGLRFTDFRELYG